MPFLPKKMQFLTPKMKFIQENAISDPKNEVYTRK